MGLGKTGVREVIPVNEDLIDIGSPLTISATSTPVIPSAGGRYKGLKSNGLTAHVRDEHVRNGTLGMLLLIQYCC